MTKIAHISDLHVLDLEGVPAAAYLNKRLTGLVSLWTKRKNAHSKEILAKVVEDIQEQGIDHVLVTGDLTNLALASEFARARQLLTPLATFAQMSVVPGNHDVYTAGAYRGHLYEKHFGDLMWRGAAPPPSARYPFHKEVGSVQVVGFSSAVPSLPLFATGRVDGDQLTRMEQLSEQHRFRERFVIGMVHHNLHNRNWKKNALHGLTNRSEVLERCEAAGIDLLLHGHTHQAHRHRFGDMWVVGCGSSTWTDPHPDRLARYNVMHVDDGALTCVDVRRFDPVQGGFVELESAPLASPSAAA